MTECIFTLDYEIYGNGTGSLRELVLDPTRRLGELFQRHAAQFVVFPEVVEFAKIERTGSDPDVEALRAQLRELRTAGHEIGLHLHPWWANARFESGQWHLDWSERNICALRPDRIEAIVSDAISFLRDALGDPGFVPYSFRSGLWAMQPTAVIADVLQRNGIRVDSSVYNGGWSRSLPLDYRRTPGNGRAWRFVAEVTVPDPQGVLWEVPIHTELVPFWEMLGRKRLTLQKKVPTAAQGTPLPGRWRDFLRLRYPQKLDFCRMTFEELRAAIENELRRRRTRPDARAPFVAIGHSKDLVDFEAIDRFLEYLRQNNVHITTFARLFSRGLEPSS